MLEKRAQADTESNAAKVKTASKWFKKSFLLLFLNNVLLYQHQLT